MYKTLIAFTFTFATQAAVAQCFAPWDARGVRHEAATTARVADLPIGFAPWRDHSMLKDVPSDTSARMSDAFANVFRPWS